MVRINYTINKQAVELGVNDSGWGLFIWNEKTANWQQLSGDTIVNPERMNDSKFVRRTVYNFYRRHFA